MTNYVLSYFGGREPDTPEESAKGREAFRAWLEGLGDAVVNPGTPIGPSKTVTSASVSDSTRAFTGFSIVKADSLDNALEIAKRCPFLEMGDIDVAEEMRM